MNTGQGLELALLLVFLIVYLSNVAEQRLCPG